MQKQKVLVIGLDGATYDLLKPWAQQGLLPTLQKLMTEGTAGELRSTIPPMTGPAWTTFMTGKNPGKHGIYDWIYRHKDSYDVSPVTAKHCHEPTVWSLLSDAGRRVVAYNVPMTFPPKPVNGLMISGMPAPSKQVTITYPIELLAEIEKENGEYYLYPDPGQAYSDAGVDAYIERLYKTTETRIKVFNWLRAKEDWDFFMLVFNGTDTVQHAMWKFMSPKHPLHDPSKFAKYGDVILNYFQYVDKALGEIVAKLDDNTTLMLMSDHGFGPFHKFIHVNNWLRKYGWLKIKRNPKALVKSLLFDLGFAPMKVYNMLMAFGLGSLKREVVRGKGQGMMKTFFLSFGDVDWKRSAAYSLGNVGQIRLNVKGREPQGIVEPGEEFEKTRNAIIAKLWELRDPKTGEKVVQEVYKREEVYTGTNLAQAADIVFIPTRMEYFGFGEYEFGSNEIIETMKRGISGTHRPNGMYLLWGKPIKAGVWTEGANLYDLAPTILHLMGEPVLPDMDGRVLTEAMKPEYAAMKSERQTPAKRVYSTTTEADLSDEDESVISERLRDLGYVG